MKYLKTIIFVIAFFNIQTVFSQIDTTLDIQKIVIDSTSDYYGYYLSVKPKTEPIKGVVMLLPGFGQKSEDIFLDTEIPQVAVKNGFLVIGFAGRMRLAADSMIQTRMNAVIEHVYNNNSIDNDNFFIGGFSAGGGIALRYTELCYEFPKQFPVQPKAVFMADSPVDLFHSWDLQVENAKNNHSEISVNEAKWVEKVYRHYYGSIPSENPEIFIPLSPFAIDKKLGTNEIHLKTVAVRAYHDIDVTWRLKNRNQTARFDNYIATSELINRLMLIGNDKAEFVQTYQTGYRRNGERHPHSWSIIDATECIKWLNNLIE